MVSPWDLHGGPASKGAQGGGLDFLHFSLFSLYQIPQKNIYESVFEDLPAVSILGFWRGTGVLTEVIACNSECMGM